jgi:hypothetical protein
VHVRVLVWVPLPQETEHSCHSLHSDHPPSTDRTAERMLKVNYERVFAISGDYTCSMVFNVILKLVKEL